MAYAFVQDPNFPDRWILTGTSSKIAWIVRKHKKSGLWYCADDRGDPKKDHYGRFGDWYGTLAEAQAGLIAMLT